LSPGSKQVCDLRILGIEVDFSSNLRVTDPLVAHVTLSSKRTIGFKYILNVALMPIKVWSLKVISVRGDLRD
jgi:hypothetical protein